MRASLPVRSSICEASHSPDTRELHVPERIQGRVLGNEIPIARERTLGDTNNRCVMRPES